MLPVIPFIAKHTQNPMHIPYCIIVNNVKQVKCLSLLRLHCKYIMCYLLTLTYQGFTHHFRIHLIPFDKCVPRMFNIQYKLYQIF